MKQQIAKLTSLAFIILILSGCAESIPEDNTLSKSEVREGWQLMFDGQTMDGWRSWLEDEVHGWEIEDGRG